MDGKKVIARSVVNSISPSPILFGSPDRIILMIMEVGGLMRLV